MRRGPALAALALCLAGLTSSAGALTERSASEPASSGQNTASPFDYDWAGYWADHQAGRAEMAQDRLRQAEEGAGPCDRKAYALLKSRVLTAPSAPEADALAERFAIASQGYIEAGLRVRNGETPLRRPVDDRWRRFVRAAERESNPDLVSLLRYTAGDSYLRALMSEGETGWLWNVLCVYDEASARFLEARVDNLAALHEDGNLSPLAHQSLLRLALHHRDAAFMRQVAARFPPGAAQTSAAVRLEWARLRDRAAVMSGEPQVYGTQRYRDGDCTRLWRVERPTGLAARRRALGLEPIDASSLCA